MKRLTATLLLCMLFAAALVTGRPAARRNVQSPRPSGITAAPAIPAAQTAATAAEKPAWADSLPSLYLYTEGIKQNAIAQDTARARDLFRRAVEADPAFAPAYYEMAAGGMYATSEEAVELAGKAWRLDSTNKWYMQLYGQTLIYADRYTEARDIYRRLCVEDPSDPDNYRLLAALYEQTENPYMALVTLDSAEVRFGRIPALSTMKRRLLIQTLQTDKAVDEARALIDAAPYDAQNHIVLANLYAQTGKDSLALAQYERAMQIDSTDLQTLLPLLEYYSNRHDYRAMLSVTRRIFETDDMPLDLKIQQFERITSDTRFYREYYTAINDLAATLALLYPADKRVVELYARHLIASGHLDMALSLYKLHLDDQPPQENYYRMVIDIESYLQRPDSVRLYIDRALALFPNQPDFHLSKGNAWVYAKQYDRAIKSYKEALPNTKTDSLRGVVWGYIGDAWHQKAIGGNNEEEYVKTLSPKEYKAFRAAMKQCYKAYDRSLGYYADNSLVLNNYAYFLSLDGDRLDKALSMSERATALTGSNPTYMDTHAWVLFRLGRAAEAKKIMQQAIALDSSNSSTLMVHYGDILYELGEQFMAETYWRKALENGYDADQINERLARPKKPQNVRQQ